MNIFFLDRCPKKCAEYHCDKHVVKMILETGQMMSTAHQVLGNFPRQDLYKKAYLNHPSTVWVRSSIEHYRWTFHLMFWLNFEYTKRYDKIHKTWLRLHEAIKFPPSGLLRYGWTDPPQCMPDYCKSNDAIAAYRKYYKTEKKRFATWKTEAPSWFSDY